MLVYIIRNGVGYLSCYAIIHLINSILYVLHFFFFKMLYVIVFILFKKIINLG